ncbi:MAG: TadE/TadG family type IV pilus assembly protein [Terriglobales bacterium]
MFGLRGLFRNNCRGTAAVEFGLIVPMLVAMLAPLVDLGVAAYTKMQVQNASQAGAEYAAVHGWNTTAIQTAVTSATTLSGISASPAPSESCGCVSGTTITAVTCGATCVASGRAAATFITVNAQAQYSTMLPYPGLSSPLTFNAQSKIRIK